uniref:Endolysin n=1 Tax=Pseudomonas phage HRDY3 TaxID=3236930 RepID=A0AB39CE72_9VIRU
MLKMYIAVLTDAPDYMVPTLVAHSVLNAHEYFTDTEYRTTEQLQTYHEWQHMWFRKVVLRVNRREFTKIRETLLCWAGHENTICNAEPSCLVVFPVEHDNVPNVLKFAKMWKPETVTPPLPPQVPGTKQVDYRMLPESVKQLVQNESFDMYKVERYFKAHAALESGIYVVQPGDYLSAIADDLGMDWRELAQFNGLTNPDLIYPGQAIRLR